MKNSTKILGAALALILISLFFYDFQLKTAYLKGNYKKPFGDFVPANYSGFHSIELRSGTAINVFIVKGPYKVLVDPWAGDFVKLSQQGSKLIIRAVFADHYRSRSGDYIVFISCPDLTAFTSDARYRAKGCLFTDSAPNVFEKQSTLISGFDQKSFTLSEDNGSNIRLENNRISQFKAVTGISSRTGSLLTIGPGNTFSEADFRILNKSTLNIEGGTGTKANYDIADSAKLTINGSLTKQILKTTQP